MYNYLSAKKFGQTKIFTLLFFWANKNLHPAFLSYFCKQQQKDTNKIKNSKATTSFKWKQAYKESKLQSILTYLQQASI
jgi:hypothetical protein